MTHDELIATPEYWEAKIQIELFQKVELYLKDNKINRTELARRLGVSKGYVSQVLNGDYDHRISKFVELSLFVGYKPVVNFEPIQKDKSEICDANAIDNAISKANSALNDVGYKGLFWKPNYNTPDTSCKDTAQTIKFSGNKVA